MLDLGSSDSGFESQRPDKKPPNGGFVGRAGVLRLRLGFERRSGTRRFRRVRGGAQSGSSDGEIRLAGESLLLLYLSSNDMPSKKFTRTIENFTCEHCDREVVGDGYTNHCPSCLWSKHVDKNPGDRLETCNGLMEPIKTERKGNRYMIVQKCVKCSLEKRNSLRPEDSFEAFVETARKNSQKMVQRKG
jgi:hypothetical protein